MSVCILAWMIYHQLQFLGLSYRPQVLAKMTLLCVIRAFKINDCNRVCEPTSSFLHALNETQEPIFPAVSCHHIHTFSLCNTQWRQTTKRLKARRSWGLYFYCTFHAVLCAFWYKTDYSEWVVIQPIRGQSE